MHKQLGHSGDSKIHLEGIVTKDKNNDKKWTFVGKMKFVDIYDFETGPTKPGDMERSEIGEIFKQNLPEKNLPGTPFEVSSEDKCEAGIFRISLTGLKESPRSQVPNKVAGEQKKSKLEQKKCLKFLISIQ